MQDRPSSPSEAQRRMYARGIEPLRQDLDGAAYHDLTIGILDTFLVPLDLTTNPTTFGPEDEDPFFLLGAEAKKVDDKEFVGTITAPPEAQALLKIAFTEAIRVEKMTVLQRIGSSVPAPFNPTIVTRMFGPMNARSVRELRELAEVLNPPRAIKQLFLPSSRYFMHGFTSVPRVATTHAAPLEVIDAAWRLTPHIGHKVKKLMQKAAMARRPTLDRIWGRWDSIHKERINSLALGFPTPLFAIKTSKDPVVSFEESAALVMGSDILFDTAQTNCRATPTMVEDILRHVQDIDPYSEATLNKFDEALCDELSTTVHPSESSRRNGSRRWASVSSRPSQPISAWKHSSSIDLSPAPSGVRDAYGRGDYGVRAVERRFQDGSYVYDDGPSDAMDMDDAEWDDGMIDQTNSHLVHYPEPEYMMERFNSSHRPDRVAELVQLAQPWGLEQSGYGPRSPLSIGTQIPLGADFARHDMDWRMPLQSSSPLASPIKIREPPTPDSGGHAFTNYPFHFGPARTLTYGEGADDKNGGFDHDG